MDLVQTRMHSIKENWSLHTECYKWTQCFTDKHYQGSFPLRAHNWTQMGYSEWQLRIVKMSRDIVIAKMDIERNNRDLHTPRLISCKSRNLHIAIVLMAVWICPRERLHTCNLKGSNWLLEWSGLRFLLLIQNTNRKDKNSIIRAVHCLKHGIIFHPRTNEQSYVCILFTFWLCWNRLKAVWHSQEDQYRWEDKWPPAV